MSTIIEHASFLPDLSGQGNYRHDSPFTSSYKLPFQTEINVPDIKQVSVEKLLIGVPELNFHLSVRIKELSPLWDAGELIIKASIDEELDIGFVVTGSLTEDGSLFQTRDIFISTGIVDGRPRTMYLASILRAAFRLAGIVIRIPELGFDLDMRPGPDYSLLQISSFLRAEQLAYWLMVIEKAAKKEFHFSSDYFPEGPDAIRFVYRAIVDRSFVWPLDPIKAEALATSKYLKQLPEKGQSYKELFEEMLVAISNENIYLGPGSLVIDDFFIENEDLVREELASGDGHFVTYLAGSLTGQGNFHFPDAPRLPDSPWDSGIQKFIDLESQLDDRIVKLYNELAASTLAGLTEEEIKEVASNPELDYRSFLGENADSEDN